MSSYNSVVKMQWLPNTQTQLNGKLWSKKNVIENEMLSILILVAKNLPANMDGDQMYQGHAVPCLSTVSQCS